MHHINLYLDNEMTRMTHQLYSMKEVALKQTTT